MTQYTIGSATSSNMSSVVTDYAVPAKVVDAPTGADETEWIITKWPTWFGKYKLVPELQRAILAKAIWTVGKGFEADPEVTVILDHVRGNGRDTFNTILRNMIINTHICGDAFAEIIRDQKTGDLINLKVLDPSSIKMIYNKQGMIKRYEQINKIQQAGSVTVKFQPNEIFHLVKDRVADEMHGTGVVESCEWIIDSLQEAERDWRVALHRNVKPIVKFMMDTDNQSEIDAFVAKMDQVVKKGENIYLPKGTVEHEIITVPTNATMNPLPWIDILHNRFYEAVGVPRTLIGGGQGFTEATSKIEYLAFQQTVEDSQLDIETQIKRQLQMDIELTFPASLQNELLSDQGKDSNSMAPIKPQDMQVGVAQE